MQYNLLVTSIGLVAASVALSFAAQTPPAFEVASVRQSPPESLGMNSHMAIDGSRADYFGFSLSLILNQAFRLQDRDQLVGPAWLSDVFIDIHATLPSGSSRDQVPEMLQALLEGRFGLKYHHELRPTAVYMLKATNGSALLTPAEEDEPGKPADFSGRAGRYLCHRCTMEGLAGTLNGMRFRSSEAFEDVIRRVIDATGIEGKYDFTLNLGTGGNSDPEPGGTRSMSAALKDLGLRLARQDHDRLCCH